MLAAFVLSSEVASADKIFNAVFFVVVISTILQGSTLERIAGKLQLLSPAPATEEPPLEVGASSTLELVDFVVAPDHAIAGAAVREVGLPRNAIIAVVDRNNDSFPPRGSTIIQPGDRLFVLAPRSISQHVEDVFARWRRRVQALSGTSADHSVLAWATSTSRLSVGRIPRDNSPHACR